MWNERYSEEFTAYGSQPNDFLREVAKQIPKGPVLCLGEGEGRNGVYLAQQGFEVTAVDQSEVGLKNAERLAQSRGVQITTVVADLADYQIGESKWAGIVSIWCHLPSAIRIPLHKACVQGLTPHGVFVLEAYSPEQLERPGVGGPPVRDMLLSEEGIRSELVGLDFELCKVSDRNIDEGKFHQGLSSSVQVVARCSF